MLRKQHETNCNVVFLRKIKILLILGINEFYSSQAYVFLSQSAQHSCMAEAPSSRTELLDTLPREAVRDENTCPSHKTIDLVFT